MTIKIVLHPYILKLFKKYNIENEYNLPDSFKMEIKKIESYVVRHTVCQVSTKNFNKDCALLIAGKTTIDKEFNDKIEEIGDEVVKERMKLIPYNKIASLILFWIELYRRNIDGKFDCCELKYAYSLEHIMPQKWEKYWKQDNCPVLSVETNKKLQTKKPQQKYVGQRYMN